MEFKEWTASSMKGSEGHCICAQVFDNEGNSLAVIESKIGEEKATKAAKIMAAAPDLLETLEAIRGHYHGTTNMPAPLWNDMVKAIEKALK